MFQIMDHLRIDLWTALLVHVEEVLDNTEKVYQDTWTPQIGEGWEKCPLKRGNPIAVVLVMFISVLPKIDLSSCPCTNK